MSSGGIGRFARKPNTAASSGGKTVDNGQKLSNGISARMTVEAAGTPQYPDFGFGDSWAAAPDDSFGFGGESAQDWFGSTGTEQANKKTTGIVKKDGFSGGILFQKPPATPVNCTPGSFPAAVSTVAPKKSSNAPPPVTPGATSGTSTPFAMISRELQQPNSTTPQLRDRLISTEFAADSATNASATNALINKKNPSHESLSHPNQDYFPNNNASHETTVSADHASDLGRQEFGPSSKLQSAVTTTATDAVNSEAHFLPPVTPATSSQATDFQVTHRFRGTWKQFETSLVSPDLNNIPKTTNDVLRSQPFLSDPTEDHVEHSGGLTDSNNKNSESYEDIYQYIMSKQILFEDGVKLYDEQILDLSCLVCEEQSKMLAIELSVLTLKDDIGPTLELASEMTSAHIRHST